MTIYNLRFNNIIIISPYLGVQYQHCKYHINKITCPTILQNIITLYYSAVLWYWVNNTDNWYWNQQISTYLNHVLLLRKHRNVVIRTIIIATWHSFPEFAIQAKSINTLRTFWSVFYLDICSYLTFDSYNYRAI